MLRMAVLCTAPGQRWEAENDVRTAPERRWAAANGVHCARAAVGGGERD